MRIGLAAAGLSFVAGVAVAAEPGRLETLSQTYRITRKYKSMEGPASAQAIRLLPGRAAELVWITGFKTEIVGKDGSSPMSPEFMCHINLDADLALHRELFGWKKNVSPRFFTLSQGQFALTLPAGFGLPVMSDEPFMLATQVLNHNFENADFEVRHKVTVDFVRDRDLERPLRPLFPTNAFGMKVLEGKDGRFGIEPTDPGEKGISCLPGEHAAAAGGSSLYPDGYGRSFSGHWVVKPGREVNHTDVTASMNVPFDTTVHYINIHLHPFAESLELRDATTGKTLFKSRIKNPKGRIGLEEVEDFSSVEGLPVFKDHRYELISVYDNTSGVDQDAMATMFLYMHDKEFARPVARVPEEPSRGAPTVLDGEGESMPSNDAWLLLRTNEGDTVLSVSHDVGPEAADRLRRRAKAGAYVGLLEKLDTDYAAPATAPEPAVRAAGPRLVLRTDAGDLVLGLFPDAAPKTVAHILELARAGAYDTTHFWRLEPGYVLQTTLVSGRKEPLTERQRALIRRVPLEAGALRHTRGRLSLARETDDPNSGESSFSIMLGSAPSLDGQYTVFGSVESGLEVLEALERTPRAGGGFRPSTRLEIRKAEVVERGSDPSR